MQFLKYAVQDAVQKHPFQRVADLTPDEFSELMTDILENALQSREADQAIADVVSKFIQH